MSFSVKVETAATQLKSIVGAEEASIWKAELKAKEAACLRAISAKVDKTDGVKSNTDNTNVPSTQNLDVNKIDINFVKNILWKYDYYDNKSSAQCMSCSCKVGGSLRNRSIITKDNFEIMRWNYSGLGNVWIASMLPVCINCKRSERSHNGAPYIRHLNRHIQGYNKSNNIEENVSISDIRLAYDYVEQHIPRL